MPIRLNRTGDINAQLSRLNYGDGLEIKEQVRDLLYMNPRYYFTADELAARIQTAAAPVQIESVLSHHPDEFTHEKKDGRLYWQLKDE